MRRSQFTDSEILHLIREADAGVSIPEICRTAQVSLRTFYRWRRRFGGLDEAAVMEMKELQAENRRLKSLLQTLSRQQRPAPEAAFRKDGEPRLPAARASALAAERCGGAVVGRFASVRVTR
ncbi:putative transposase [Ancylobacter aquaticus]|uniref:Putative transposase n=1 Tax=Ancylobacter aquaticus TaxID=100 RepID=A0A4R1HNH8_ANCAQ|nr:transposase [Ancylobacter aquaticus]TCK23618.1 putative transposase [Ancylobacter aquaticus]